MFYNSYYISKDEIHIIRTAFVKSGLYGSIFQSRCIVNNDYTVPREYKRANFTSIQVCVLNNDIIFHHKIFSFNFIPKILAEKIIKNIKRKAYFDPSIVDPAKLKLFPECKYEPLDV